MRSSYTEIVYNTEQNCGGKGKLEVKIHTYRVFRDAVSRISWAVKLVSNETELMPTLLNIHTNATTINSLCIHSVCESGECLC